MYPTTDASEALSGLTDAQRDAARQQGAVVVLAGAGTGKTRTLVAGIADRIVRRGIQPHRILAVTFTNKAAGEMKSRVADVLGADRSPYWVGTFHGHGRRQLRTDPEIAGLRPGFDICDAEDSRKIVRRLIRKGTEEQASDEDTDQFRQRVKSVSSRIAMLKDDLILPEDARAATEGLIATRGLSDPDDIMAWRQAAALYPVYQAALREANLADFGVVSQFEISAVRFL
jgi:DNA helicase-2/ATP-dependent DNA helicase PcrA